MRLVFHLLLNSKLIKSIRRQAAVITLLTPSYVEVGHKLLTDIRVVRSQFRRYPADANNRKVGKLSCFHYHENELLNESFSEERFELQCIKRAHTHVGQNYLSNLSSFLKLYNSPSQSATFWMFDKNTSNCRWRLRNMAKNSKHLDHISLPILILNLLYE